MRVPRYAHPILACQYDLSEGHASHLGDREWYASRLRAATIAPAGDGAGEPARVLEIGSGTGRVTQHLVAACRGAGSGEAGVALVALDIGLPMLVRLGATAPGVPRVCADMTRLPVRANACAVALSAYNVLGCLLERELLARCFACVAQALVPGGRFLFDVAVHHAGDHVPGPLRLEREEWRGPDGLEIRRRTKMAHDAARERLELRYEVTWRYPGRPEERLIVPFALNTWAAGVYAAAIDRAGFETLDWVEHTFDGPAGRLPMWVFVEAAKR